MTLTIRLAQSLFVAYIGVFGLLTAFDNITDYGSNFAFVRHVMSMDTIFPESHLRYRAITGPALPRSSRICCTFITARARKSRSPSSEPRCACCVPLVMAW